MANNSSTLENLAAFTIVFVVGVIACASFAKYLDKVRKDAQRELRV
jgi:hypothetical protein